MPVSTHADPDPKRACDVRVSTQLRRERTARTCGPPLPYDDRATLVGIQAGPLRQACADRDETERVYAALVLKMKSGVYAQGFVGLAGALAGQTVSLIRK